MTFCSDEEIGELLDKVTEGERASSELMLLDRSSAFPPWHTEQRLPPLSSLQHVAADGTRSVTCGTDHQGAEAQPAQLHLPPQQ